MEPVIGDSMTAIAEEAERQGFLVRQTRRATWHFRKENHNWYFTPKSVLDVLEALSVLIAAGLEWKEFDSD